MPSHEDDAKGGFTLGSGFKKLGVQNKPRWTLLWDSSLEISFSNQVEYFLELGPPRFGGRAVPHFRHFNFHILDSNPSVYSLINKTHLVLNCLWFEP